MKALILGAGFGTRLERDLKNDTSNQYTKLIGVPKPLLPIGRVPLITHWVRALQDVEDIDGIYVVTNAINHQAFEMWARDWPLVKLVCEGATSNETRIGAVACIHHGVQSFNIKDDVMVIAGDTLFYEDFNLKDIIQKLRHAQEVDPKASLLLYVTCSDQEVHKYGILETNASGRVRGFLEKPQPHETASRKECPCFYLLSSHSLPLLNQFLEEKKDEPLKARDATGNFIAYLYPRMPVYTAEISGRFDVGGLESYKVCHEHFLSSTRC